jgi:hypothetical protein
MPKDEYDPEDPLELVGVEMPSGDPDQAMDDIVQEYLLIGWKPARILFLFRSPYYGATHWIYQLKGHEYVKQRIGALAEEWNRGWLIHSRLLKEGETNAPGV